MATKLRLLILLVLLAIPPAAASPASASLTCSGQTFAQPFRPWLDPANYVLVQNGALEFTKGWTLAGGAKQVAGNEPWKVNRATDARSLLLPAGSSATSPPLCITLLHPTLRLFAANSGSPTAMLRIEVLTLVGGIPTAIPVGLVVARSWQPTPPLAFLTNLAAPVVGSVQFRFTALGAGARFQIDDVYVDPYKHR